jgi:hypothetical protein
VFTIDGARYAVPYFGIVPKIIDFAYSVLPEEGVVSNVVKDRATMFSRPHNDLLVLFHWVHQHSIRAGRDKMGRINKILHQLEPNGSYIQFNADHIRKIESQIPTYEDMIKNPVWDEYKKFSPPKSQIYNEFTPNTEA